MTERYWSEGKRLRPKEIICELEKNLYDELDMMREASSASQLRRNFENINLLYVPEINWSLTKKKLISPRTYLRYSHWGYRTVKTI